MHIRHLVTKGFGSDLDIRKSVVYSGTPLTISSTHTEPAVKEETIEFNKQYPPEINTIQSLEKGKDEIIESPIGYIVSHNDNILPLSQVVDYSEIPEGASFEAVFEDVVIQDFMRNTACTLFPNINPQTGQSDIDKGAYYTPYIPLVTLTGCIPPQKDETKAYFNPNGVVTVAEFLDGLNAIKYGSNANNSRKKTLDNISTEEDYFNEGYQSCLRSLSSPFFNLYTRKELTQPITRLELAYITVICWTQFIEKFNNLYGGVYYLGINFDWEAPAEILADFVDGFDYKVSKISIDSEYSVTSLNIKDYCSDRSMEEYKQDIKSGVSPIALPAFMSLVELGVLGLFKYEDNRLDPMKEVSRGEFCYFLSKLACMFPTKYFNN